MTTKHPNPMETTGETSEHRFPCTGSGYVIFRHSEPTNASSLTRVAVTGPRP